VLSAGGSHCIFCSIVEGRTLRWTVYEDEAAIAFLDAG
jgi:diadenosine tetraphosphate (Ap4A) HIT family hydrolase